MGLRVAAIALPICISACTVVPTTQYSEPEAIPILYPQLPQINVERNGKVERERKYFLVKDRQFIPGALYRGRSFYLALETILQQHGLPKELIAVAVIESRLDPQAGDHDGKGIWQFAPATGKEYGLRISRDLDDRTDVILSTQAAAVYLRTLFQIFNDWPLALAAYNTGPNRIKAALRRSGATTFWELSERRAISPITIRYVPRFFAAKEILTGLLQAESSKGINVEREQ